jgi:hypothetical protein
MGRVVLYPQDLSAAIDEARDPLLREIGGEIERDAIAGAPELTGALKSGIHAQDPSGDTIEITAEARHPDEPGPESEYAYWVEVGTSDTPASRYLERALYRQRG